MKYTVQVEADIKDNGVDVMVKQVEGGKVLSLREGGRLTLNMMSNYNNKKTLDKQVYQKVLRELGYGPNLSV